MRDGEPAVEWTCDGNDEMDPAQGRGWAVVKGDELNGMIFFHGGDDSAFAAIAAKLNEDGVPTRSGGPWRPSVIGQILGRDSPTG